MSPIVRIALPRCLRTQRAIPLLALVTALAAGCNGRSTQTDEATPVEGSVGAERGLPSVEHYAHRLDDPARDAWQRPSEVVGLLDAEPGETLVDLGFGTGYFLPYLSAAAGDHGQVVALDISERIIVDVRQRAEAANLANVVARVIPPNDPAIPRRSADAILIVNTWHHIEGRVAYAKKLRPSLRGDGRVVIVDFTMESPIGPPVEKRLTIDTVVAELQAAGFTTEILEEDLPHQYAVAGRAR